MNHKDKSDFSVSFTPSPPPGQLSGLWTCEHAGQGFWSAHYTPTWAWQEEIKFWQDEVIGPLKNVLFNAICNSNVLICLEFTDGQCFVDNLDDRVLPFYKGTNGGEMTIEKCKQLCFEDNTYSYAGIQYGGECWCGNGRPNNPAPLSECSMACSGDNSQKCGAPGKMNAYHKPGRSIKNY